MLVPGVGLFALLTLPQLFLEHAKTSDSIYIGFCPPSPNSQEVFTGKG